MRPIKKHLLVKLDQHFRYQGVSQTRIEAFSDGVFAVAFTLVVLSATVPETFQELRAAIRDILPSFICVVLIVVIWFQHYLFFLRYGLQDTKTVVINTVLLFLLLIYIYPLKFLARFLVQLYTGFLFGESNDIQYFGGDMTNDNMQLLMVYYGAGATMIFMALTALYRHAYRLREDLELSEYEVFCTKSSILQNLLMSLIPFISTLISLIRPFGEGWVNFAIAGFAYMLYPPVMIVFGARQSKKSQQFKN